MMSEQWDFADDFGTAISRILNGSPGEIRIAPVTPEESPTMTYCGNADDGGCPRPDDWIGSGLEHCFSGYGWMAQYHPECCPRSSDGTGCDDEHPTNPAMTMVLMATEVFERLKLDLEALTMPDEVTAVGVLPDCPVLAWTPFLEASASTGLRYDVERIVAKHVVAMVAELRERELWNGDGGQRGPDAAVPGGPAVTGGVVAEPSTRL